MDAPPPPPGYEYADEQPEPQFEQGQQQRYFPSTAIPYEERDRASIVEQQLDTKKTLERLRNYFLGRQYDEIKNEWITIKGASLANESGVNKILGGMTAPMLTPEVILANMTDTESKKRAEEFEIFLAKQLVIHESDWEIQSKDALLVPIGNLVFANLTRPIGGDAHKGITTISRILEQQSLVERQMPQERRKGGFLSILNPFNKGGQQ